MESCGQHACLMESFPVCVDLQKVIVSYTQDESFVKLIDDFLLSSKTADIKSLKQHIKEITRQNVFNERFSRLVSAISKDHHEITFPGHNHKIQSSTQCGEVLYYEDSFAHGDIIMWLSTDWYHDTPLKIGNLYDNVHIILLFLL